MIDAAKEAEETLVEPLFEFRNFGIQLAHNWSTVANGAEFGTDYLTRTAVAKSNIWSTHPSKRSTSIRTSTRMAAASTAQGDMPSRSRKIRRHPSMDSAR